jgi:hypothetical protein
MLHAPYVNNFLLRADHGNKGETTPMSHSLEFEAFLTSLYDAQANLEAKLRTVTAIRACADRHAQAESAEAIQAIRKHIASLHRLNAAGGNILKSLSKALQALVVPNSSRSSPPPAAL